MDKFQQAQQANALALQKAALENAQAAKTAAEAAAMRREAERQANIAKNLGHA